MPWLSVIVPIRDGERHLPAALDSILLQCDPDLEVIAVDDDSTDTSPEILDAYARNLPLRRIRLPHRMGWVAATRLGLDAASGQHACFLHQDDAWLPGRCDELRRLLHEAPHVGLIIHETVYLDDSGVRIGRLRAPLRREGLLDRAELFEALLVQNFISAPSAIFSLEAARQFWPLESSLWYAADWAFWLALSRNRNSYFLRRELAAFRVHSRSQTSSRSADVADFTGQLRQVLNHALQDPTPLSWPRSTPAAAELSILVNGFLAGLWSRNVRAALIELAAARPHHLLGLPIFLRTSRIHERAAARIARMFRS